MKGEPNIPDDRIKFGFENTTVLLKIEQIVALKELRPSDKTGKKYAQIISSIRTIGLVEFPVVTPDHDHPGVYFLLDGHLRNRGA